MVVTFILTKGNSLSVGCSLDDRRWVFDSCGVSLLIYFIHVFVTMQILGTVRAVFIKSTKKISATEEFKAVFSNLRKSFAPKQDLFGEDGDLEPPKTGDSIAETE